MFHGLLDEAITRAPLVRRDRGEPVKVLQGALVALGYSVGRHGVDGIYGPDTAAAVKAFQVQELGANPNVVSGDRASIATLQKLEEVLSQRGILSLPGVTPAVAPSIVALPPGVRAPVQAASDLVVDALAPVRAATTGFVTTGGLRGLLWGAAVVLGLVGTVAYLGRRRGVQKR